MTDYYYKYKKYKSKYQHFRKQIAGQSLNSVSQTELQYNVDAKFLENIFGNHIGTFEIDSKKLIMTDPSFVVSTIDNPDVNSFNKIIDVPNGEWFVFALYNQLTGKITDLTICNPIKNPIQCKNIHSSKKIETGIFGFFDFKYYTKHQQEINTIDYKKLPHIMPHGVLAESGIFDIIVCYNEDNDVIVVTLRIY